MLIWSEHCDDHFLARVRLPHDDPHQDLEASEEMNRYGVEKVALYLGKLNPTFELQLSLLGQLARSETIRGRFVRN